jgi:hypothetical protein
MSTIILKTANRTTRVSRLTVRRAVAAAYAAVASGTNNLPVPVKGKAVAAKKAIAKK